MARITKNIAATWIADVPYEFVFTCYDGRILKNLKELEIALIDMKEGVFFHHVTKEKNDFANWVRGVVYDEKLARDLAKTTNNRQAAKVVSTRVAFLEDKLNKA